MNDQSANKWALINQSHLARLAGRAAVALAVVAGATSPAWLTPPVAAQQSQQDDPEDLAADEAAERAERARAQREQGARLLGESRTATRDEDAANTIIAPSGQDPEAIDLNALLEGDASEIEQVIENAEEPTGVDFSTFSEPLELAALVEFIGAILEVNFVVRGELTGSVNFVAPFEIDRGELLMLTVRLLDLFNYSVSRDATGFYIIEPAGEVPVSLDGTLVTTRVLTTPNVRPSTIQAPLTAVAQGSSLTFIDELGVILVRATPKRLSDIEMTLAALLASRDEFEYFPIPITNLSASVARDRAIGLVGGTATAGGGAGRNVNNNPGNNNQSTTAPLAGGSIDNLSERLIVDPQSNSLIFYGRPGELERVNNLITVIDVPNALSPKQYEVGPEAANIAGLAQALGLGEVVVIEASQNRTGSQQLGGLLNRQGTQNNQTQTQGGIGGPTMVVDLARGVIIYYGTATQQAQLDKLIATIDPESDVSVIRVYKLNNADAVTVAELLQGVISGQQQAAESAFLPGAGGGNTGGGINTATGQQGATGDGEVGADFNPDETFVIADEANNQIIARAPRRQQEELAKLIERVDLRRPQVYLTATIISVTEGDDFSFASEVQAAFGEVQLQSEFGLSDTSTGFQDERIVLPNLAGFTGAILPNDYVPLIISTLQSDTTSRIVSTPQLLVNDNEEASVVSLEQQATTETVQGDATTTTSFNGFEDAGTTLEVTPSIAEAGFLRLDILVQLSNFVGPSGTDGIPSDRLDNTITSSVTLPSDSTFVIGGIKQESDGETIDKIPILGDIPLIGALFSSRTIEKTDSTLYIFITPKILTEPNFEDLRLLTYGPQAEVELPLDVPPLEPATVRFATRPGDRDAEKNKPEDIFLIGTDPLEDF